MFVLGLYLYKNVGVYIIMKKKYLLFLVMSLMLVLTACRDSDSKTFFYEEDGVASEMTFTHNGDTVEREVSTTTLEYEALGLRSEEDAEEVLSDFALDFEDVDGVTYSFEYEETEAVETLEINYEEVELSELREAGIEIEGEEGADEISMEQTEENLIDEGYEITEDSESE